MDTRPNKWWRVEIADLVAELEFTPDGHLVGQLEGVGHEKVRASMIAYGQLVPIVVAFTPRGLTVVDGAKRLWAAIVEEWDTIDVYSLGELSISDAAERAVVLDQARGQSDHSLIVAASELAFEGAAGDIGATERMAVGFPLRRVMRAVRKERRGGAAKQQWPATEEERQQVVDEHADSIQPKKRRRKAAKAKLLVEQSGRNE